MKATLKQLRRLEDELNAVSFFDPELAEALDTALSELHDWRTAVPNARAKVWRRPRRMTHVSPGKAKASMR